MIKLLYKHTVLFIIFSLIFNLNSIAYSQTDNTYKIETKNLIPLSSRVDIENIPLDNSGIDYFNVADVIGGTFLSILLIFPAGLISILISSFIVLLPRGLDNGILVLNLVYFLTYDFMVSLMVYNRFGDKEKHSYAMTLLGSIIGSVLFILLINLPVLIESFVTDHEWSKIKYNGWILFLDVVLSSFLVYITTTIFYAFSKKDTDIKDNKKMTEKELESLINESKTTYKNILENVKVSNGNLSYSVIKF